MPDDDLPVEIIGKDDWLIFGKLANGWLVYATTEGSAFWRGAPNWKRPGNDYGSPAWAEDWRCMLDRAASAPEDFWWSVDELAERSTTEMNIRRNTQRMVGWPREA